MAICLRRNFRSCSSFALVGGRNRLTNRINLKLYNSDLPFFKEKPPSESSSLNISLINSNSRGMTNFQPSPESVLCAQECKAYKEEPGDPDSNLGKPDKSQLDRISNILVEDLPKLFVKHLNYAIYHPDLIFENNIRGTKTKGLFGYAREIALLKVVGHIKFASVMFHILKITVHPEDGTVRLRWRITGVSNYRAFFSFLKPLSSLKKIEHEGWYDGFSVYFVRSDGLVHKLVVDKMIPDSEEKVSNIRNNLAAKLAFAVGITMKSFSIESLSCEEVLKTCCQNHYQANYSVKINRTFS